LDNKKLYDNIMKISNIIHKKNIKGGSNYIIVSSKVAEAIENLDIKKLRKKKLNSLKKFFKS